MDIDPPRPISAPSQPLCHGSSTTAASPLKAWAGCQEVGAELERLAWVCGIPEGISVGAYPVLHALFGVFWVVLSRSPFPDRRKEWTV